MINCFIRKICGKKNKMSNELNEIFQEVSQIIRNYNPNVECKIKLDRGNNVGGCQPRGNIIQLDGDWEQFLRDNQELMCRNMMLSVAGHELGHVKEPVKPRYVHTRKTKFINYVREIRCDFNGREILVERGLEKEAILEIYDLKKKQYQKNSEKRKWKNKITRCACVILECCFFAGVLVCLFWEKYMCALQMLAISLFCLWITISMFVDFTHPNWDMRIEMIAKYDCFSEEVVNAIAEQIHFKDQKTINIISSKVDKKDDGN